MWNDGLIFTTRQNGVFGRLLKLLQNYLNNREQLVALNGFQLTTQLLNLVSLTFPFLDHINDLDQNMKSNVKFFADDTMRFSIVNHPVISADELNHDLEVINDWAYQWNMEFNHDPKRQAPELLFSCKKNSSDHPLLFFNGTIVPKVNEQKDFGFFLDSNLSFERQINEKIIKAKKGIGIIKYLSKFFHLKALNEMYKALVRLHLDYCDIIYHIRGLNDRINVVATLNSLMEKFGRTKYQAALAITGTCQGSNLPTLEILLHIARGTLYRNNNPNTFREIRCKTSRYKNSVFPDAISS